jgi:hypothetical protein
VNIRKTQMDVLERHQREAFVARLEGLLADALPEYFLDTPAQECRQMVARLAAEALRYGINLEHETANYAQLRLEAGEAFDEALNNDADFRQALENRETPGSHKLALIEQRFLSLE